MKHLKYVMRGNSVYKVGKRGRPKGHKHKTLKYIKKLKRDNYEYGLR